jgi:hypothetical protein
MTSYDDAETEAPLDPAAARLRRKLVRLLFVSGGIMMLGLIAVFSTIVYKLNEGAAGRTSRFSAALPVEGRVAIPIGARVVSTALDGDRALLTLSGPDGQTSLLLVDLADGAILGRYAIAPE